MATRTRTPKTVSVADLEETLKRIGRRSFRSTPQEERNYIRESLRSLWTPQDQ